MAYTSHRTQRPALSGPAGLAIQIAIASLLALVLTLGFIVLFGQGRYRSANPPARGTVSLAAVASQSAVPAAPVAPSRVV